MPLVVDVAVIARTAGARDGERGDHWEVTVRHPGAGARPGGHVRMIHMLLSSIPDPAPSAPAEVAAKVTTVLGLVKWTSLMAALAVLLGSGALLFAAERGHGGGMSPQLKSTLGSVLVVLIVVGSASQLVQWLS